MDISVFEVSYEVANKVGGIYTVLESKAHEMLKNFKNYYTVGPYYDRKAAVEFEPVRDHTFKKAFEDLEREGIRCYYGTWSIGGKPNCILVDPKSYAACTNDIKYQLWEKYGIDSLGSPHDYDEPVIWATAVGRVIQRILEEHGSPKNAICHCHEWLAGPALLYLKSRNVPVSTVFTTHATVVGRTLAESGVDLVKEINSALKEGRSLDDNRARELNVLAKHLTEKACAHNADAFTTVSDVTAEEAKYILGKEPDVLTLNGLDIRHFPTMEEASVKHSQYKKRINHFALAYFSPYYTIDPEETLYYFFAGRSEFHNKGIDMLVEASARLNEQLRKENSRKTIVLFIFAPTYTTGRNPEVLDNASIFESMVDEVDNNLDVIAEHIIESVCSGKMPTRNTVFDEPFLYDLKKMIIRLRTKKDQNPPLCAMSVNENDPILQALRSRGLLNRESDRVKVIYYPAYLSSADGLLGLNLYEAFMGCHMGIFPSYYEPWGYTTLETAVHAVPAVTTDLSGFGKFIQQFAKKKNAGITVLDRKAQGDEVATQQLLDFMYYLAHTDKKERGRKKIEAKALSELTDWQLLIQNYIAAYEKALEARKQ